ncbi:MAG: CopG family transcriptional regulator [Microthrixaceae bacterium]|nr:CopG family transcriptional regulator [Microthrixaceae bacterium]MCO5314180.1 CopG family transcriptional regulator [Microthrixaceae bacterium]
MSKREPKSAADQAEMTPAQEFHFYEQDENQIPQGPPRRRKRSNLSELVPVRFEPAVIDEVRSRAAADDRSVSSWIRRAVERELERQPPFSDNQWS